MRNKIVAGLIGTTGLLFTVAVFVDDPLIIGRLSVLGVVAGLSAVFTRVLIKENI